MEQDKIFTEGKLSLFDCNKTTVHAMHGGKTVLTAIIYKTFLLLL